MKCSILKCLLGLVLMSPCSAATLFWLSQENFLPNGNPDLVDPSGVPIPVGSQWAMMMFIDDEADGTMNPDFFFVAPQFIHLFPGDDSPEPMTLVSGASSFAPGDFFNASFNDYANQLSSLINEEVFTVIFNDPNPMNASAWAIVPELNTGNTITFIDVGIGQPQFDYVLGEISASDWNQIPEPNSALLISIVFCVAFYSRTRRRRPTQDRLGVEAEEQF